MTARNQRLLKAGFFAAAALAMAGMVWFGLSADIGIGRNPLPGSAFPRGRVLDILDHQALGENVFRSGQQALLMEILTGEHRGKIAEVRNIIFIDAMVNPRIGQTLIVHFDYHGNGSYSAHVHSYARETAIYAIVALFLILIAIAGGKAGISSAFGLVFAFVTLLFLLIPAILRGGPPALLTIAVALLITAVSLTAIMGFEKKTWVGIAGTSVGIAFYCLFYAAIASALNVSGANIPEMNQLAGLGFTDALHLTELLFCGILIASLGAVTDTTVSVASATAELGSTGASLGFRDLFRSSMRMARDCIGSSANTLILAFTGTFFVTLIMFRLHELNYAMLINRIDIAIEVLRAISASAGMVLCAPATALLGSYAYRAKPEQPGGKAAAKLA